MTSRKANAVIASVSEAIHARFWFVMSMALIVAYPVNWRLVANHLKHGMMTVRPKEARMAMAMGEGGETAMGGMAMPEAGAPSRKTEHILR